MASSTPEMIDLRDLRSLLERLQTELNALRRQVDEFQEQHTAALAFLQRFQEGREIQEREQPQPIDEHPLARCAHDVVQILRDAGKPLTTLEILDALVQHHRSWRESMVRHVIEDLRDRGIIEDTSQIRPYSYALAKTDLPSRT